MDTYELVFLLHLTNYLLGITNELSQALPKDQKHCSSHVVDQHLIKQTYFVKWQLQKFREDGWEDTLDQAYRFCELDDTTLIDMEETMTRRRHKWRRTPLITNLHYYRAEIFYQVLFLAYKYYDLFVLTENLNYLLIL